MGLLRGETFWSCRGQKGGWHPCALHRLRGSGRQSNCARCKAQDTRGWRSLAATLQLKFSMEFPEGGPCEFELRVVTPIVPFVVTSKDRNAVKLPGMARRAELQKKLGEGE